MGTPDAPADDGPEAGNCEIRVRGHLGARWSGRFGDLAITRDSDGTTVLRGPVTDQAALHGLLRKVGDLGLPLISVTHHERNTTHTTHNKRSAE